jgi:hypothetical protein
LAISNAPSRVARFAVASLELCKVHRLLADARGEKVGLIRALIRIERLQRRR